MFFFFLIKSICQAHFSVSASCITARVQQGAAFASVIFQWVELEEEKKALFSLEVAVTNFTMRLTHEDIFFFLKNTHKHAFEK